MVSSTHDQLYKFIFDDLEVRGEIVQLHDVYDNIFANNREFFDMYTDRRQVSATGAISRVKVLKCGEIVNFLAILYNKSKW